MGKRSRPEETDGGGVNPFPPPEALSQATSSRGSKKSKPSPTEAGPDPSGVAFKRPPRKEPRKEKRAEKKARLEKDRQDKEKAENIDSVRQLQNLIAFSPQSGSDSDNEQRNGKHATPLAWYRSQLEACCILTTFRSLCIPPLSPHHRAKSGCRRFTQPKTIPTRISRL